ncbi:MAG TPA: DUF6457 domain-containing protein [Solirubrobacteraceae bacterium]|nr:DUF6457 domain-containing protein [Solirubrobacteraceae bacterium]
MDARAWLAAYAEELGVAAPSEQEVERLLALAGVAAHASERIAAPIACWLAARAGADPERALALAKQVGTDA